MGRTGRKLVGTLAAVVLLGVGCGGDDAAETPATETPPPEATDPPVTEPAATEPPATEPTPTEPAPTEPTATEPAATEPPATDATEPAGEVLVNVYWASQVVNPSVCCEERIGAGARIVPGPTVARGALEAMLAGPDGVEAGIGMTTTIPTGTRLLDLAATDGVATVDLSGEFEEPSGSLIERFRVAQVVFTLTQFDNIDRVVFRIDGVERDTIMSHGIPVGDGVTRADDPDIRPAILLEYPHPGAEVTTPLVIRGESNTFEATVQYVVTAGGGDGIIVAEGFTTATAGSGVWGTFEQSIDFGADPEAYLAGPGSVIVFETSAEDGAQVNIVEYPITLPTIIFSG